MSVKKKYLLSTLWTQYGKVISCGNNEKLENGIDYNEYAPFNKHFSDNRSYTGCGATAVSQIVYYHLMKNFQNGLGYELKMDGLSEQDAYVSHADIPAAAVYISAEGSEKDGTLSFEEINNKLTTFVPVPTNPAAGDYAENSLAAADYIAALNFSVGVMLKSGYSPVWGTGSVYFAPPFQHFGFKSFYYVDLYEMSETERSFWVTENKQANNHQLTDEAIDILIENMENGRPVALGIPGHAIVLDGYDRNEDLFHLNYGWGPENNTPEDKKSTRWYTRDELRKLGTSGFVMDISPVFQETFTVTDASVCGRGTLYRAIQQATAMQGANIITFDAALEEADALELPLVLELKDKTTFSGFNMTVFAGENDAGGEDAENVNENEDSNDAESEEEENSSVIAFYGEQGSRTQFNDFRGNIIANSAQETNCAALDFSDAVQLSISTVNANIYAGISLLEHSDILDKMSSGDVDELLENVQMKVAVSGSDGDDHVSFDEETLVFGNIELEAGHDSLTVDGNSIVYGDIDMGSGDNKITISAGSSIHGDLLSETELCIKLTGSVSDALLNITGDAASTFENITSITIDANDAEMEEYILFNQGSLETLLEKLQIKGEGGVIQADDGSIWWNLNDGYSAEAEEEEETPERTIAAGESVSNATVGAEELWLFADGSIAAGSLSIAEEGEVKVMTGAKFIFDISAMSEENTGGIINNFDGINGTFHFSINAAVDQAEGTYLLAENVTEWSFSTPITVSAGEKTFGSFEDDEDKNAFTYGDDRYELCYDEDNKTLSLVIESAFRTIAQEDGSIELSWHKPAAATGYWMNISRRDENGSIEIFSDKNALNIVTATSGEYEWQVLAPGLETEYREGGDFSVDENQTEKLASSLFDAGESNEVVDVFIAESSGIWGRGYAAQHMELPEEWRNNTEIRTKVDLICKNRYSDIFKGAENDSALLYLSDSENGDALFLDDVYSAFPDSEKCERLSSITAIYAGNGDDIIDLTSQQFEFFVRQVKVYGGDGNDVIWAGKNSPCYLYGDRGNDCLIGSAANDCFIGGAGDDVMHGGGGNDLFAYGDPSTWGNDSIYQLAGEGNSVRLFFEQEELKEKLIKERFEGGMRLSVAGYENSSITIYSSGDAAAEFAGECYEYEYIFAGGGCGESASEHIFENNSKGILA